MRSLKLRIKNVELIYKDSSHDLRSTLNSQLLTLNSLSGQALVTLLVFVATAIIITGAAVAISVANTQATGEYAIAANDYQVAEAGVENAILRLLRDSTYSGETLTIGDGTATITVSGTTTKTITSVGSIGTIKRTIQVVGTFSGGAFTITSWQEID